MIFCVNSSIVLEKKSLFENESFLMNFRNFFGKILLSLLKILHFFANFLHYFLRKFRIFYFAKISHFLRANDMRKLSEMVGKFFFAFLRNNFFFSLETLNITTFEYFSRFKGQYAKIFRVSHAHKTNGLFLNRKC